MRVMNVVWGVKHDYGTEQVFTACDPYLIEPGHDGWTVDR